MSNDRIWERALLILRETNPPAALFYDQATVTIREPFGITIRNVAPGAQHLTALRCALREAMSEIPNADFPSIVDAPTWPPIDTIPDARIEPPPTPPVYRGEEMPPEHGTFGSSPELVEPDFDPAAVRLAAIAADWFAIDAAVRKSIEGGEVSDTIIEAIREFAKRIESPA